MASKKEAAAEPETVVTPEEEVAMAEGGPVFGPQEAPVVPNIPFTREDFAELLLNPERDPQRQSAPPQELLNPHLFP